MHQLLIPVMLVAISLVFLAAIVAFVALLLRPWIQCFLSNAPVSLPEILAMRLRRSPARKICEQRIKASYVGIDLSVRQLEEAHQQGADIEKLVDALCLARRSDQDVGWGDLLDTELSGSERTQ